MGRELAVSRVMRSRTCFRTTVIYQQMRNSCPPGDARHDPPQPRQPIGSRVADLDAASLKPMTDVQPRRGTPSDVVVPDADPERPRALAWDKYSDQALSAWYALLSQ